METNKQNLAESLYGRYIMERTSRGGIVQTEAGFITYRKDGSDLFIIEMYVAPEMRRSKCGTELMKKAEDVARELGCERITGGIYLEDNGSTITVMAALSSGFKVTFANAGILQVAKTVRKKIDLAPIGENIVELIPFSMNEHFGMVKNWFDERKFQSPDPKHLPSIGLVALINSKPVASGFLFRTDAGLGMIGNLSSDPKSSGEQRNLALDHLIDGLSKIAINEGFVAVSCATNLPGLKDRFKRLGFSKTDENVDHFRRNLCH